MNRDHKQMDAVTKQRLINLCTKAGLKALAAQVAVGDVSFHYAILQLAKYTGSPTVLKTVCTYLGIDSDTFNVHRYVTTVEKLEALSHGISEETYLYNKSLSLSNRLKLPVWEAIFALNYKEKSNGDQEI